MRLRESPKEAFLQGSHKGRRFARGGEGERIVAIKHSKGSVQNRRIEKATQRRRFQRPIAAEKRLFFDSIAESAGLTGRWLRFGCAASQRTKAAAGRLVRPHEAARARVRVRVRAANAARSRRRPFAQQSCAKKARFFLAGRTALPCAMAGAQEGLFEKQPLKGANSPLFARQSRAPARPAAVEVNAAAKPKSLLPKKGGETGTRPMKKLPQKMPLLRQPSVF